MNASLPPPAKPLSLLPTVGRESGERGNDLRSRVRACAGTVAGLLLLSLTWVGLADGLTPAPASADAPTLLLVVGADGEPEFGTNFLRQAQGWTDAAKKAGARLLAVGLGEGGAKTDLEELTGHLSAEAKTGDTPLWLILIGHGTFDGKEARFNLRGPDFTATQFAEWMMHFERPLVVINTASASAPFMPKLTGTNRIVLTATRSGNEQNFARLGAHLAEAIADPESDRDKDGQTSVLEAFLTAASRVAEFYKTEGRLATEHALIDDNGDGLGTPADWFRGVRAVKRSQQAGALDGARAQQVCLVLSADELALPPEIRVQRDELELEVFRLRDRKASLAEDEYYSRLEVLLLKLARLQESRLN